MIGDDDRVLAELVALGRGLHWPLGELLDLEHGLRRRLLEHLTQAEGG
ncbi:hypothetical protein [Serinicoccus sediminis]|nr:hypothetical protein [Serinicoccus sediminis]